MLYLILFFVAVIAFVTVWPIRIVDQNTVAVTEVFGKFFRILKPGLNIIIPFFERTGNRVSLRQMNFEIKGNYPTKDKVIVSLSANLMYAVLSDEKSLLSYVYGMDDVKKSINAVLENSLRTYIANSNHDKVLEDKEIVAADIKAKVSEHASNTWGVAILDFQIVDIVFPKEITDAMSKVVASDQLRKAAENEGEAIRIKAVKSAEAEKQRKQLSGEGVALEREAIAKGMKEQIEIMSLATGKSPNDVMSLLMMNQYVDMMRTVGSSENTKVIFVDSSASAHSDTLARITNSIEAAK